jgi:hypothetical protein
MKNGDPIIELEQIQQAFEGRILVKKGELRQYVHRKAQGLSEQGFQRVLYDLKKRKILIPIGAGLYGISVTSSARSNKLEKPIHSKLTASFRDFRQISLKQAPRHSSIPKRAKFVPVISPEAQALNGHINQTFPYIDYLIWETRALHELMNLQPGQAQIIVEVEKDAREAVFNMLSSKYSNERVYLEPNRTMMERYVLRQPEGILVLRLVTQSPKTVASGTTTARLEKILVDLFADTQRFYAFQGSELINIYENAFEHFWVNSKTLMRYAGRRKVKESLLNFIQSQTSIHFTE